MHFCNNLDPANGPPLPFPIPNNVGINNNILICMDGAKTLYPNETLSNFFCLFYCSSFQMVEALIPFLMRPTDFTHLSHTTLEWKSLQCWTTWSWFRWSTLLELRSGMNKWDSGFLELYFGFHCKIFLHSGIRVPLHGVQYVIPLHYNRPYSQQPPSLHALKDWWGKKHCHVVPQRPNKW